MAHSPTRSDTINKPHRTNQQQMCEKAYLTLTEAPPRRKVLRRVLHGGRHGPLSQDQNTELLTWQESAQSRVPSLLQFVIIAQCSCVYMFASTKYLISMSYMTSSCARGGRQGVKDRVATEAPDGIAGPAGRVLSGSGEGPQGCALLHSPDALFRAFGFEHIGGVPEVGYVCCMLCVVCVVCCMLYVSCCMLYIVCCMLYVVCCVCVCVCVSVCVCVCVNVYNFFLTCRGASHAVDATRVPPRTRSPSLGRAPPRVGGKMCGVLPPPCEVTCGQNRSGKVGQDLGALNFSRGHFQVEIVTLNLSGLKI